MIVVSLTGRLTREPELRRVEAPESEGGVVEVCEVRVAARDGRGRTVFLDCAQWGAGGRAAATYLTKGSLVTFTGELRSRQSNGDGPARRYYSAVGRIEFLGGGNSEAGAGAGR